MTFLGAADGRWSSGGTTARWAARTDVGRHRRVNEDSLVVAAPLFAVADGMGGHAAGDTASGFAVERLREAGMAEHADASAVAAALLAAAGDIDELSDRIGVDAGTTAAGVVLGDPATAFNVGDSRVYTSTGGRLAQVTVDHSLVQELVEAGELDPDEAESHPASNVVTRALGFHEDPRPDFVVLPREDTRILVCSDGLTKEVDARHLRLLLGAGLAPGVTAEALVDAALAAGGHDNVSVIVVDVAYDTSEAGSADRG